MKHQEALGVCLWVLGSLGFGRSFAPLLEDEAYVVFDTIEKAKLLKNVMGHGML